MTTYNCFICNYSCNKKGNLEIHLLSQKHLQRLAPTVNENDLRKYKCNMCNNRYEAQRSLWRHNQKCKPPVDLSERKKIVVLEELVKNHDMIISYKTRRQATYKLDYVSR